MTTIGGCLEEHYRPSDDWLLSEGFKVMVVNQQNVNSLMSGEWTITNGAENSFGSGNANNAASAGQSFVVPLPHVGANWYPDKHRKVYVNAGESCSAPSLQCFELAPGTPNNAVNLISSIP